MYFLPDRILVWDTNGVGAVGFEQLGVYSSNVRFAEEETVPPDAQVVDNTWKYANKSGGPDRRFSNNYEIPIVEYEELSLTSRSGLNEMFQISRKGLGAALDSATKKMALAIVQRGETEGEVTYAKCPCSSCGTVIEFPSHGAGEIISCPTCGAQTLLALTEA